MSRGAFALVLHSHLPWLAHHGRWPVGEEWLYQSWATSYLQVLDVLDRLADEGRRNLVTLGITPVLAAQLDDPHTVAGCATWLGFWQARSETLAGSSDPDLRQLAAYEFRQSQWALAEHARRGGLSPSLRRLRDAGAVELLGGPATHPFQPLYPDEVVGAALRVGRDDAALRWGAPTAGIWAPECGYRPGLEAVYAEVGVEHFMVDGPTFLRVGSPTWAARPVGDTDVVAFARDLDVTYRVWSPRRGYPSDPHYRDFYTFDHGSGFRRARVTSVHTPPEEKAPYQPAATEALVRRDAADFVATVAAKLDRIAAERGRPGLVVAGYDTELFGHWWHEGPRWLEHVLRLLPEAGVEVTTFAGARAAGYVGEAVRPQPGSWGSGKDWRVWAGPQVADIVADNDRLVRRWLKVDAAGAGSSLISGVSGVPVREALADQIAREALLALSSDWAFMVTKDSAAQYARARHDHHHRTFSALVDAWEAGARAMPDAGPGASRAERPDATADAPADVGHDYWGSADAEDRRLALVSRQRDGLFAHLDSRVLW